MYQDNINMDIAGAAPVPPVVGALKRKVNVPAIVLGVVALVCAGVAGFFGVKYFTSKQKSDVGPSGGDAVVLDEVDIKLDGAGEIAALTMADEYSDVQSTMEAVTANIENNWDYIENDSGLLYKPEGLNTYVPMRLNLTEKINNAASESANLAVLEANLRGAGFEGIGTLPFAGSAGPQIDGFLNANKNIVCGVYEDNDGYNNYVALECAKTDWTWMTEAEKELVGELEQAYYNKTAEYPSALFGLGNKVKDSEVAPYQTLSVSIGGGYALFYRSGSDAEWQYFKGGQALLDCGDYDTDELRKAFAGSLCYDGAAESVVQP